ncbi:hypothetical protein GCM10011352_41280 [Marinobacterium zhoushanense]|uniref:Hemerythrin-like domain-containing protein n=1 Tax=Marinobacterium zhoushanense TaxID=1679163 RepID=A0ABQ1KU52_9GAMM|nr:hemerythrin domain-containing protein [Marinobacterium zhoushanense]GGC10550.1 hypothetical protein GCM10011352_41280 [Marinobacterium zhoushanense]
MPKIDEMLCEFNTYYRLGDGNMDQTHIEFLQLCQEATGESGDQFAASLNKLFEHTQQHFSVEEQRMIETAFPSYAEHRADHQRTLGELERFARRATAGKTAMARIWLNEGLPGWFDLHAKTMDSALAAHLKGTEVGQR